MLLSSSTFLTVAKQTTIEREHKQCLRLTHPIMLINHLHNQQHLHILSPRKLQSVLNQCSLHLILRYFLAFPLKLLQEFVSRLDDQETVVVRVELLFD
jgi:hypothetical protein